METGLEGYEGRQTRPQEIRERFADGRWSCLLGDVTLPPGWAGGSRQGIAAATVGTAEHGSERGGGEGAQ